MAVSEGTVRSGNSSLLATLQSLWAVVLAIFYTRLDLATVELEEAGTRAIRLAVTGLAALAGIAITSFFLLFFLVVTFWDERVLVLAIVTTVSLLGTVSLVLITRSLIVNWPGFLTQTLTELRRDVEALRPDLTNGDTKP